MAWNHCRCRRGRREANPAVEGSHHAAGPARQYGLIARSTGSRRLDPPMTLAFAIFLVLHGLVHVLGFIKAFNLAELPQLTQPISPLLGILWLVAAFLFLAAAGALVHGSRWWWAVGAAAIVVSMVAILPSWSDARFGALANLVALAGIVYLRTR